MVYYTTYLKDIIGNNYLGIQFDLNTINPFLKKLKDLIGDKDYEDFTNYQKQRDRGSYHLTIINVIEYNKLADDMGHDKFINSLQNVFKYEIDDLKMMGIGTAHKGENRAYFVVCKSDKIDSIRKRYRLDPRDIHITIGFKYKDVFGVRKNKVLEGKSKFLRLLKNELIENNSFKFIKRIENFKLDPTAEIIPIGLTDNYLKVKCQDYYMDISYLEDGEKFWIMTKYPAVEDKPRMSMHEIIKELKERV